jgi:hypothetical protein
MTTKELDLLADRLNSAALLYKEITHQAKQLGIIVQDHIMYDTVMDSVEESYCYLKTIVGEA